MDILAGPMSVKVHTVTERDISMSLTESQNTLPFLFRSDFSHFFLQASVSTHSHGSLISKTLTIKATVLKLWCVLL